MWWRRTPSWFQIQPGKHGTSIFTHYIALRFRLRLRCSFMHLKYKGKCIAMGKFHLLGRRLCLRLHLCWGCSHVCLLVLVLALAFALHRSFEPAFTLTSAQICFYSDVGKVFPLEEFPAKLFLMQNWVDGFYRDSLVKLIAVLQMILERYCVVKEQATNDFFWKK